MELSSFKGKKMQEFSKDIARELVDSWKIHNKNQNWVKKAAVIARCLSDIKSVLTEFDESENEFLQTFYINSSDGNLRSTFILELSEKYPHAEYFFIDRYFTPNINTFYADFSFTEKIISKKDLFTTQTSVENVLKGEDKSIISLYVFLENLVKNFNIATQDMTKRNAFKYKIVKFYDSLYRLLSGINADFSIYFFDLALHNQPLILIEFVKTIFLETDSFDLVEHYISDESLINFKKLSESEFERIDKEALYYIVSSFSISNEKLPTCVYSAIAKEFLEGVYDANIEKFSDFYKLCNDFVNEFEPFPSVPTIMAKFVFASLFFEYIKDFKGEEVAKNTIFYGPIASGKTRKIQEIIKSKNLKHDRFKFVYFHDSFEYDDFIDGFVGGKFINGEFKQICKSAMDNPNSDYFFIIDNVNGGRFDRIFGDTIKLLDKRYDENDPFSVIRTKNSHLIDSFDDENKQKFSVLIKDGFSYFAIPKNLYILCGTNDLNSTISASSAKAFEWVKMSCDYGVVEDYLNEANIKNSTACVDVCKKLNNHIMKLPMFNEELGHGIFMKLVKYETNSQISQDGLNKFFDEVIEPILKCIASKTPNFSDFKQISAIKSIMQF